MVSTPAHTGHWSPTRQGRGAPKNLQRPPAMHKGLMEVVAETGSLPVPPPRNKSLGCVKNHTTNVCAGRKNRRVAGSYKHPSLPWWEGGCGGVNQRRQVRLQ